MRKKRGMILVTTLWILALLTLLAIGIGIRMGVDIKLISFFLKSSKAHYLAEAGLRKTIEIITEDGDKYDSLDEAWSSGFDFDEEIHLLKDIELGDGTFTVSHKFGEDEEGSAIYLYGASDEEGKLNINELDKNALAGLPGFTDEIADAIIDWRDEDDIARSEGAENDYYREELDNPYECKNGKFKVPEELLLVKGVTLEIYEDVKDIITVYGEDYKVNINTASKAVLAALIGSGYEDLPAKIIAHRNGDDEIPGTEDDKVLKSTDAILSIRGIEQWEYNRLYYLLGKTKEDEEDKDRKNYFKVASNTFRIVSRGNLKNSKVKKTIEAVVKRDKDDIEFLYYYEN